MAHHGALLVGYAVAMAAFWLLARAWPALWPVPSPPRFAHPWREVLWTLLAAVACVGIGQLYQRKWLPPAPDAVLQLLIFSPFLLQLLLRRQGLATAWLPRDRIYLRVPVGVALGCLGLLAYSLVRAGARPWPEVVSRVYSHAHFSHLVQVGLEDVAIAILFVRLQAAMGARGAVALTAALFATGHVPALMTRQAELDELLRLFLDVGLGVLALAVLRRCADMWVFWGVHFALDMSQFHGAA